MPPSVKYKRKNERPIPRLRQLGSPRRRTARGPLVGVGAAALLLAAGLFFIYPFLTTGEADGSEFVVALGARYFSDQGAREELTAIWTTGLPAFGRLARLDENGTWTRVFLGPFADRREAALAAERLKEDGLAQEPLEIRAEPPRARDEDKAPRPVVAELETLVGDDRILDELIHPETFNIYALARTAVITEEGEVMNRIYLGPFADEKEAVQVLDSLDFWALSSPYILRYLDD